MLPHNVDTAAPSPADTNTVYLSDKSCCFPAIKMPSVLPVSDLCRVLATETLYIYHLACATSVPFSPGTPLLWKC